MTQRYIGRELEKKKKFLLIKSYKLSYASADIIKYKGTTVSTVIPIKFGKNARQIS